MTPKQAELFRELQQLTDDERMDIFVEFCRHCGCIDPTIDKDGNFLLGCQCWNDE